MDKSYGDYDKKTISKAILRSQHCQRNFDLNQTIPEEDIKLLKSAVSQCPSKQNIAFYRVHFIFDRETIEAIYETTTAEIVGTQPVRYRKNPQVLGNLLVVFEQSEIKNKDEYHEHRNSETANFHRGTATVDDMGILANDRNLAIGIAAGYLNLTASLLGYATGCCSCFDESRIQSILQLKNPLQLLMGIGFKDKDRNRTEHHLYPGRFISTFKKQSIEVKFLLNQPNINRKTSPNI